MAETVKIRAVLDFLYDSQPVRGLHRDASGKLVPGEVVEVPRVLARELIQFGKAEWAQEPPAPQPLSTRTAGALVR